MRPPPSQGTFLRRHSHESIGGGHASSPSVGGLAPQVLLLVAGFSRISWWRSLPRRNPLTNHLVAGLPADLGGGACPAGPLTNQLVAGDSPRFQGDKL